MTNTPDHTPATPDEITELRAELADEEPTT